MTGAPAIGFSSAVDIPAQKVFQQTHVETKFYQSVGSDLSWATHVFEGSGGESGGKRSFDTMLDYLDGLEDAAALEWKWSVPQGIDSNRLWKHIHGSHSSEWDPSNGKWRVVVTTYPAIAKMQHDVKNRSFDGGVQVALQRVADDNGLRLGGTDAKDPTEFKRIIQSNQSDWEFVVGHLMYKVGLQTGVEMFTTNGDDLNLSDPFVGAQKFTPHGSTVLAVLEHEDSFNRVIMGGNKTHVEGFDHYLKTNTDEEASSVYKMQHKGKRHVYVPSRKNDALESWASARVCRHSTRHRSLTVRLTGFAPDEVVLPMVISLDGGFYRKKRVTGTVMSAFWQLRDKRLIVDLTARFANS